jgi:hypothetical protein
MYRIIAKDLIASIRVVVAHAITYTDRYLNRIETVRTGVIVPATASDIQLTPK